MFLRLKLPGILLCVAVLAGCGALPRGVEGPPSEMERTARTLLDAGRHREAAEEYLRLAAAVKAPSADRYRLAAISALIDGGEIRAARSLLADTQTGEFSRPLIVLKDTLAARIALAERQPELALELVPAQNVTDLPPDVAAEVHLVRASAYLQMGQAIQAARERVELEFVLTDAEAIRLSREHIWQIVTKLPPTELLNAPPPPDTLGGWLELAQLARDSVGSRDDFAQAMGVWRKRFPGHPANEDIVPDLLRIGGQEPIPYEHIALLLPFEGPFAKAAETVRDGFFAAWFNDTRADERPVITIHDTAGMDIWTAYDNAVNAGADFVVGPLDKSSVAALAGPAGVPVPTLALNHAQEAPQAGDVPNRPMDPLAVDPLAIDPSVEDAPVENPMAENVQVRPEGTYTGTLYQFALSPELEARQVAERAWLDGHTHVAMLTPEGPWGERVAQAFRKAWERIGGVVVEHQVYSDTARQMSQSVQALLNVDESAARRQRLERQLKRKLKHQARRRQDVDFVFLAAFPREGRQLRPQLEFHHASNVPVYSTSHVYTGVINSAADRDLDGVVFGDIPWVLSNDTKYASLRNRMQKAWPESVATYTRLYAFGADAYTIIPHLERLRLHRFAEFQGQTGRLSVDDANRVNRQLIWARFTAGTPRLVQKERRGL